MSHVLVGVVFLGVAALVLEILWRLTHRDVGVFELKNFLEKQLDMLQSRYPAAYDEKLGYIPTPGYSGSTNKWSKQVDILDHGLRSHGQGADRKLDRPVLCVGDSFVFGDMVSNHETWPAHLQTMLDAPVANGGVFGYGLDQTVLRGEVLARELGPRHLLAGFIPSDIKRTRYKVRTGVNRPYFDVIDGQLVLSNVPVPPTKPKKEDLGWFRSVFGYSFFVDWCMKHAGLYPWWNLGRWSSEPAHSRHLEVSRLLMDRLAGFCRELALPVTVVVQYNARHVMGHGRKDLVLVADVLEHAREAGLDVLDTFDPLRDLYERDGQEALEALYDGGHMNSEGNRFIARLVADHLS